jgi:acyl-CoA synthetase (AMP-forming)/AMP-acid ligase II
LAPMHAVWLQTYLPNLYAGMQISLQCLLNGGTLVSPGVGATVDQIIELMLREHVEFASATPAYWRRLLMFGDSKKFRSITLKQITLGGEVVDQQVLDMLKSAFPTARIAHIYATSELGRCFSVTDGTAGFPADWIGKAASDGVELNVQDDELLVRSPNSMQGYDELSAQRSNQPPSTWIATGDLVKRNGDRYMFVGRRSDVINVGGHKVFPQEVEPLLRAVPGVADVRVYGQPSSLVGQLVAAQIVAASPGEAETVKVRVIEATKQLSPHQRPRLVEMVDQTATTSAGKIVRE